LETPWYDARGFPMARGRLSLLVAAALFGVAGFACGGGGGGSSAPTQPSPPTSNASIAGSWSGSAYDTAGNSSGPGSMTWQISQTSASFSGTMTMTDAGTSVTGRGTVSGTVSGTSIQFSIAVPAGGFDSPYASCTANVTGTAVVASTSINGNYSGSSACSGTISSGLLTLIKQ
jgi:hypothetical protein